MTDEEQERQIALAAAQKNQSVFRFDGSGKDGVPGGQDQYRLVE